MYNLRQEGVRLLFYLKARAQRKRNKPDQAPMRSTPLKTLEPKPEYDNSYHPLFKLNTVFLLMAKMKLESGAVVLSKKNKTKKRHRRPWLGSSVYTLFTYPLKQP